MSTAILGEGRQRWWGQGEGAVSLQHVHTQRRCVDMPLLLPRLTDPATTVCKLLQSTSFSFFFLFKVEGKKKCMVTAILSQHRRGLPFVFYKKINKKYWKILIFPFIFFFNLVEFWSFLENYVTLERALEFTTSCKEDTQNAYKQFGAPAHTRPNTVHKQWWKVGCNFFFKTMLISLTFNIKGKQLVLKGPKTTVT